MCVSWSWCGCADTMQLLEEDKAKAQADLQDSKRKLENMTIALEKVSVIQRMSPVYSRTSYLRSYIYIYIL
jgi:hypothetical protein